MILPSETWAPDSTSQLLAWMPQGFESLLVI